MKLNICRYLTTTKSFHSAAKPQPSWKCLPARQFVRREVN